MQLINRPQPADERALPRQGALGPMAASRQLIVFNDVLARSLLLQCATLEGGKLSSCRGRHRLSVAFLGFGNVLLD